jgi:type IV pilus assembly protein PilO
MKLDKVQEKVNSLLDDKVAKLNRNHKIGICAAAVLIPLIAFYFLNFAPKNDKIGQLKQKQQQLEREIREVEKKAADLKKYEAEMAETNLMFQMASNFLPQQQEIPSLLTNISSKGTNSGLEVFFFRPKNEKMQEFYAKIPVEIKVSGPYHNVGVFLDEISKLSRIVSVDNINMGSPKKVDGEMLLDTNFTLITYRFIEPAKGAKKKRKKKR